MDRQYLAILGHQPDLSIAELERILGPEALRPVSKTACLLSHQPDFSQLGGSIKMAVVLQRLPFCNQDMLWKQIERLIATQPRGHQEAKSHLGISFYGFDEIAPRLISSRLVAISRQMRQSGMRIRAVPNRQAALSSATVWHNRLDKDPNMELMIVSTPQQYIIARTIAVQDLQAFSYRDYGKPFRTPREGMLPPKLARMMINLADPQRKSSILDPFCGSGTVLLEALSLKRSCRGSDINPSMVAGCQQNLDWWDSEDSRHVLIEQADARQHAWQGFDGTVACELDLGPPLKHWPPSAELESYRHQATELIRAFIKNLQSHPGVAGTLCLAIPAWFNKTNDRLVGLDLFDWLDSLGYNLVEFKHVNARQLIYRRPKQIVARQIVLIRK